LLDDAANSIRLGDMNKAVALRQKMDDLLIQLIKVRITSVLTLQPWPKPTFTAAGSNRGWQKLPCRPVVFWAQSCRSGLGDQSESVLAHYINPTGAYTSPYKVSMSMFTGANNVYISNGTFNIITTQTDTMHDQTNAAR